MDGNRHFPTLARCSTNRAFGTVSRANSQKKLFAGLDFKVLHQRAFSLFAQDTIGRFQDVPGIDAVGKNRLIVVQIMAVPAETVEGERTGFDVAWVVEIATVGPAPFPQLGNHGTVRGRVGFTLPFIIMGFHHFHKPTVPDPEGFHGVEVIRNRGFAG